MPQANQLPYTLTKEGQTVGSVVSLLSERYTKFHQHVHSTLTHQTHAKKQFRTYNKQLRGYLKPKAQQDMVTALRKFIADQEKNPPPLKDTIKEIYSLLQQLTKAIKSIEKQLKKDHGLWTSDHEKFIKDVVADLVELRKSAEYSESVQLKAAKRYKKTERYSPAVCEAYVQTWLKRCNEDYIDVTFRDCKELTKVGYAACRALYATDKITEKLVDDALTVTKEGRSKTNGLLAQIQRFQSRK